MSVIIPIPNNVWGNIGNSNDYKGISLCSSILKGFLRVASPILKLLEIVITQRYSDYFETSSVCFQE